MGRVTLDTVRQEAKKVERVPTIQLRSQSPDGKAAGEAGKTGGDAGAEDDSELESELESTVQSHPLAVFRVFQEAMLLLHLTLLATHAHTQEVHEIPALVLALVLVLVLVLVRLLLRAVIDVLAHVQVKRRQRLA